MATRLPRVILFFFCFFFLSDSANDTLESALQVQSDDELVVGAVVGPVAALAVLAAIVIATVAWLRHKSRHVALGNEVEVDAIYEDGCSGEKKVFS